MAAVKQETTLVEVDLLQYRINVGRFMWNRPAGLSGRAAILRVSQEDFLSKNGTSSD